MQPHRNVALIGCVLVTPEVIVNDPPAKDALPSSYS
jgi:hypothetical protein